MQKLYCYVDETGQDVTSAGFRQTCPNFGEGTYRAFLTKHCEGNGKETELFQKVSAGRYRLLRPFRYEDDKH